MRVIVASNSVRVEVEKGGEFSIEVTEVLLGPLDLGSTPF
jgi:hypothetical protein